MLGGLSVIIPVAEDDEAWKSLLPHLATLTTEDEVILSSKNSLKDALQKEVVKYRLSCVCRSVLSPIGRAHQLNMGARWATKTFFWFLHGDSKVSEKAIQKLKISIKKRPKGIHFFNLKFLNDGPSLTIANEYGAWIRSRIFRLPFGDQGYCLHQDTFAQLSGFCETATYGEDHLLIWKAHQNKIKLHCVGETLYTSARRYASFGWVSTTSKHLWLTIFQGAPAFGRLIKSRVSL